MKSKLIEFKNVVENEGELVYFESMVEIPFEIKRSFCIYNVPHRIERANHASINTDFVLIAINGSVTVMVDDGNESKNIILEKKNEGLYIPRMTWMRTYNFSRDAVLLVMASEKYKDCHYIEDYAEFKEIRGGNT